MFLGKCCSIVRVFSATQQTRYLLWGLLCSGQFSRQNFSSPFGTRSSLRRANLHCQQKSEGKRQTNGCHGNSVITAQRGRRQSFKVWDKFRLEVFVDTDLYSLCKTYSNFFIFPCKFQNCVLWNTQMLRTWLSRDPLSQHYAVTECPYHTHTIPGQLAPTLIWAQLLANCWMTADFYSN